MLVPLPAEVSRSQPSPVVPQILYPYSSEQKGPHQEKPRRQNQAFERAPPVLPMEELGKLPPVYVVDHIRPLECGGIDDAFQHAMANLADGRPRTKRRASADRGDDLTFLSHCTISSGFLAYRISFL